MLHPRSVQKFICPLGDHMSYGHPRETLTRSWGSLNWPERFSLHSGLQCWIFHSTEILSMLAHLTL